MRFFMDFSLTFNSQHIDW